MVSSSRSLAAFSGGGKLGIGGSGLRQRGGDLVEELEFVEFINKGRGSLFKLPRPTFSFAVG